MPERYKRHYLKAKESRDILEKAFAKLKDDSTVLAKKGRLEAVETESAEIFLLDGKPILIKIADKIFPTLVSKEIFDVAPRIVVDMGAVPYICKGANVMAPGIRRFEGQFQKGDIVFVIDEKHGKPIAVGETLYEKEEAMKTKQGIVVKTLHFVGDRMWNSIKELSLWADRA